MYKIVTCNCKRDVLDLLKGDYKHSFSFDCICNSEHKLFAIRCKLCLCNAVSFARNYFASVVCSCRSTDKDLICQPCKQVLHVTNFSTLKICVKEKDLPEELSNLMDMNKYLEMCRKADPFLFLFNGQQLHSNVD